MKIIETTILLAAVALLFDSTAQAQSRLQKLRDRFGDAQQTSEQTKNTTRENPIQKRLRDRQSRGTKGSTVSNTNTTKNVATKQATNRDLPKYDFAITGIRGSDDALMVTVQNQGFIATPANQVQVTIKDRVTGQLRTSRTVRVAPMEPNKVVRVRMASLPLGNSVVHAVIDPYSQVAEANEQNNLQTATFDAPSVPQAPNQRADLTISRIRVQGNMLSVLVFNQGATESLAAPVNVELRSPNGQLKGTGQERVGALKRGESRQVFFRNLVLDDVTATAEVDPHNRVPELNEKNNIRSTTIANQTQYAPDLMITGIQFRRQQKEVVFTVRNVGPVAQNEDVTLTVKSYFGPGNLAERYAMRVSRLNTGQSMTYTWKVEQMNTGMQFEGVLDISNRLPEQNENNNRRVATFN